MMAKQSVVVLEDGEILYDADDECEHEYDDRYSGVKCIKCGGWFCY
jgi:hypothetical protein